MIDAIVVGAGPAGLNAAAEISGGGLSVLLVDREYFPRHKPCGGGLTVKALAQLQASAGDVICNVSSTLRMGIAGRTERLFQNNDPICGFVVREQFDLQQFESIVTTDIEFEKIKKIEGLEIATDYVRLLFDGGRIVEAKYLVGADGANGVIRRYVTPKSWFHRGFAVEGKVSFRQGEQRRSPEFIFGVVDHGYGWIFPKEDHWNVGVYTCKEGVKLSKAELVKYASQRLGRSDVDDITGFPLGFGGERYQPRIPRVLLAGDAAGFAEPLLGEGIHNAIKSGRAAGRAIRRALKGRVPANMLYHRELDAIRRDVDRCDRIARSFFYPNLLGRGFGALKFPVTETALMRGFAAGKTLYEITNTFYLSPFYERMVPESLRDYYQRSSNHHHVAS